MSSSALNIDNGRGLHVAIIMDGNGRWATARGLPRSVGHRRGADAVRRTVEAAPRHGVSTLTLYAFSSDNWKRPRREVALLMRLFADHLTAEVPELVEKGVRLSMVGRRDRLPPLVRERMDVAEAATRHGTRLHLRLAVDYSARDMILQAAARIPLGVEPTRDAFSRMLAGAGDGESHPGDVDLLVRTGGERRLSDFLLWECAYAELYFSEQMWPEFDAGELESAVRWFRARDRRFGAVPEAAAG
jgi:undecaprenyl diphosphate synthase